jgi:hypothetical protein
MVILLTSVNLALLVTYFVKKVACPVLRTSNLLVLEDVLKFFPASHLFTESAAKALS